MSERVRKKLLIALAAAALTGAAPAIATAQVPDVRPPVPGSQGVPMPGPTGGNRDSGTPGDAPNVPPGTEGTATGGAPTGTPGTSGGTPAAGTPGTGTQPIATLPPPAETGENKVVHDQAYRALRNKDYQKAGKLFERLAAAQPEILDYRLNYALCLYETGRLNDARDIYDRILSSEPDNVEALVQSARILSKTAGSPEVAKNATRKAEVLDTARDMLKKAAREGLASLRALKLYPEFADFNNDVILKLELIRAPQTGPIENVPRDPFHNPLPTKLEQTPITASEGGDRSGLTGQEQEQLVKKLEALFAEIDPLVERNDFEGLGRKWGEIDEILAQEKQITSIDLSPKFKELMKKHREKMPVIRSFLLRYYYTEGERMVDAMKQATDQQDHQRAIELWQRLEGHAKKMVQTDDKFAQPAADLLEKGRPLYEVALKLKEIEQIKLNVNAIVMGGGVAQAIVNNRILAEGDPVFDSQGNPIPELRVEQIKRRRVRFNYKGLAFEPRGQLERK
jgi:tetratricopeptide (TPR) repeat protein